MKLQDQKHLDELVCPDCGTCSIRAAEGSAEQQAACGHCGRQFPMESLSTYIERFEAVSRVAETEPCSLCSSGMRSVRSFCDRISRTCLFVVVCEQCDDVRLV
ncbi:MAG: hypothetical protein GY716_00825 [bacterium]|nr:hypothetical protein [bacterium]